MSSAEEQEILARIGQLAGQINRHKSQQAGAATSPAHHYHPYHCMSSRCDRSERGPNSPQAPTNAYSSWGRGAGGYQARGGRGAKAAPHRHRSLILNNTANHNGGTQPGGSARPDPDSGANSDASSSSWVTKKDRHLQLINPAVYEKEAQARSKAMAESTRQKERVADDRERSKLLAHLRGGATPVTPVGYANARPAAQYEVVVDGIRFNVAKNGSKLVKITDNNAPKATPKMAIVGGVKFYRSRNGNLYRHGLVKAQRRSGTVRKVDTPCRMFSMTGSCTNGPRCRYIHDPAKVAICRDFLVTGNCISGDSCDLSHELTDERTPACVHYAKGKCTNPDCQYAHMQVTPGALVCRDFGMFGYCSKGANCDERHVFECPDFSNTGVCKTKGCKLPHRERASVLRKAGAAAGDKDVDMADISSDEDGESVDSNDVDSDAVDEFLGDDDASDEVFDPNQEYIQL